MPAQFGFGAGSEGFLKILSTQAGIPDWQT